MKPLKAFFSYFGSKVGAAAKYPEPRHDLIVEPFAGAAGYSVRHHHKQIELFDASPTICGVWRFLIRAKPADILALPLETADVRKLTQAERDFIAASCRRVFRAPALRGFPRGEARPVDGKRPIPVLLLEPKNPRAHRRPGGRDQALENRMPPLPFTPAVQGYMVHRPTIPKGRRTVPARVQGHRLCRAGGVDQVQAGPDHRVRKRACRIPSI